MATIKDIARVANVSQSTVSNVLNGRGNVSLERSLLVYEAAKKLGYVVNGQAKQLRTNSYHNNTVAILLPTAENPNYITFFNAASRILEAADYQVLLFITNGSPTLEKQVVDYAAQLRIPGLLSITSCADEPELYQPILSGSKVVFALRSLHEHAAFVSFDFARAGEDIGRRILESGYRHVGLMTGPSYFPDSSDLAQGLKNILEPKGVGLQIVQMDEVSLFSTPFEFFDGPVLPDILVVSSTRMAEQVRQAASIGSLKPCPPIIVLTHKGVTRADNGQLPYELDYGLLGQKATELLISQLKGDAVAPVILPPAGFLSYGTFPTPYIKKELTLRLTLSKAPFTDALMRMAPSYMRRTGIQIQVDTRMPSNIFHTVDDAARTGKADIVRSTMSTLSLYDKELFYTFEDEFFQDVTRGMFPRVVRDFSCIGGECKAIPFDIGSEMLVYRRDLFEDPLLKRMYYEETGDTLDVPESYEAFVQISRFFDRRYNPRSPVTAGTGMAPDAMTELSSGFTLRYLHYTGSHSFERGKTFIDVEAVCKAVKNMEDCSHYAVLVKNQDWLGATLEKFVHGETAMEMIYLNYASDITQLQKYTYGGRIGYAPIPKGRTYVTGGSLMIPRGCKDREAALDFIRWATHPDQAVLFTLLGGLSPHSFVYSSSDVLAQYPWYKKLPSLIESGEGRGLWDTLNSSRLEEICAPLLKALTEGKMDSAAVLSIMIGELNQSLL